MVGWGSETAVRNWMSFIVGSAKRYKNEIAVVDLWDEDECNRQNQGRRSADPNRTCDVTVQRRSCVVS